MASRGLILSSLVLSLLLCIPTHASTRDAALLDELRCGHLIAKGDFVEVTANNIGRFITIDNDEILFTFSDCQVIRPVKMTENK
jgi:hypothetical protein